MELKLIRGVSSRKIYVRFNRTFMELKLEFG